MPGVPLSMPGLTGMNRVLTGFRVLLANLTWLLTCLPGWVVFLFNSRNVKGAQQRVLVRILRANANTDFGRRHHFNTISSPDDFGRLPLSDYEDYLDDIAAIKRGDNAVLTGDTVDLLQPTSGSTSAIKLIPCTRGLLRQFKAAIDPWIASLYLAMPSLLFGRHYWSISPATPCSAQPASAVRIGFADDSEYLGRAQRLLARTLFAVPAEIARVEDHDAFEYLTLLFLCREQNLRLISVWHPSFFTVLLKALPRHLPSIMRDLESGVINENLKLDPELQSLFAVCFSPCAPRASELGQLDFSRPDWPQIAWPRLRLISCWTEGTIEPWLSELAGYFPRACIQSKGLTATEGIISIPWGQSGKRLCTIGSHYLEFMDTTSGGIHHAWELEIGKEYGVVLTTAGGLYRYRLHDLVRVSGFFNQIPCLDFITRDNMVSDLVGEKLNARHIEDCIRSLEHAIGERFEFAMLAPVQRGSRIGYVLFVQTTGKSSPDLARAAILLEEQLIQNFHYRHARNLGQLEPVRIFQIDADADTTYRRRLIGQGMKAGDIKFQKLSTDPNWDAKFAGDYVGQVSQ